MTGSLSRQLRFPILLSCYSRETPGRIVCRETPCGRPDFLDIMFWISCLDVPSCVLMQLGMAGFVPIVDYIASLIFSFRLPQNLQERLEIP